MSCLSRPPKVNQPRCQPYGPRRRMSRRPDPTKARLAEPPTPAFPSQVSYDAEAGAQGAPTPSPSPRPWRDIMPPRRAPAPAPKRLLGRLAHQAVSVSGEAGVMHEHIDPAWRGASNQPRHLRWPRATSCGHTRCRETRRERSRPLTAPRETITVEAIAPDGPRWHLIERATGGTLCAE